ncbi:MAG TPA: nitrophenyl compound nitroreductase subunit ArsF family protein [Pirellulaceae bacterium]|nr:nitrophenyl compound nitroreductase subunit ArsF family protein [Pirellulaceae bacterium]
MKKPILTISLLLFVGVSLLVAMADVTGWRKAPSTQNEPTIAEHAQPMAVADTENTRFIAMYFHAPHRCPTCKKIEAYAHGALSSEIEAGNIAWQVADYTADEYKAIVEQCKVFTSTVVLVDRQNGEVVRWKNLEEVWNHTDDPEAFEAFINESWDTFKSAS